MDSNHLILFTARIGTLGNPQTPNMCPTCLVKGQWYLNKNSQEENSDKPLPPSISSPEA
jgi:hypothetical protein